jgi:hypothetical protein
MQEIIEHIHHSQPLSTILGISYRDNGIVRRTPDRPLIVHGQSPQNC